MQVCTFLWFDGRAEEAAAFYTALFDGSAVVETQRAADGGVSSVVFDLGGQHFIAYNGGTKPDFAPAVSLYADCETQDEVDRIWAGLTDGGHEGPGGSLVDRFGVTWQVVPRALAELLRGSEPDAAERVLEKLHTMTKIDIKGLIDARDR